MSKVFFEAPHKAWMYQSNGMPISVKKSETSGLFSIGITHSGMESLISLNKENIPQLIKLLQIMETIYV